MKVHPKIINAVRDLYGNPSFDVTVDGITSETKTQSRVIRQGCPLSPYLFAIVMTCLAYDVKARMCSQ
eukprot:4964006-Karenia_brevis.AAC.1